jgi:hypothetical protein
MISKIKEYGPTALAWFGFLQFLQPLFPSKFPEYLYFQCGLFIISIIIAIIYKYLYKKIYRYKFISLTQKLKLEIYYDDIFKSKYDSFIRVIAVDSVFTIDTKKISSKSVYVHFLKLINTNTAKLENLRQNNNQIVQFEHDNLQYYFVKLADFDKNDKIVLDDIRDYFSILYNLCEYIENNAKGRKILCPVLGGRISFKNSTPTSYDRLNLMKLAFETYNFKREVDITIIVKKDKTRPKKYDLHSL